MALKQRLAEVVSLHHRYEKLCNSCLAWIFSTVSFRPGAGVDKDIFVCGKDFAQVQIWRPKNYVIERACKSLLFVKLLPGERVSE